MAEIGSKERWEYRVKQPFSPVQETGGGSDVTAAVRAAYALEYIAAQLGEINARLRQAPPKEPPKA